MFVSQRKRAVFDQSGVLQKVDVLRTVRRKEVPQSSIEDCSSEEQKCMEDGGSLKKNVNFGLVLAVVVMVLFAGWSVVSTEMTAMTVDVKKNSIPMPPKMDQYDSSTNNPISWQEIQSRLRDQQGEPINMPESVNSNMTCTILANNQVSCHFTIPLTNPPL